MPCNMVFNILILLKCALLFPDLFQVKYVILMLHLLSYISFLCNNNFRFQKYHAFLMILFILICLLQLSFNFFVGNSESYQVISCRDPDVGGDIQNKDRKFLVLGKNDYSSAGIGNLLIFFPAAYYFAVITSRDILINDQSLYGEICSIIKCGFPMLADVKLAFPNILNDEALSQIDELKAIDFNKYMEKSRSVTAKIVRAGWGITSKSDWWVWYNTTAHCISKITGCTLGDIMCAERHAYQRLIRGPFISKYLLTNVTELLHIQGMSNTMLNAIINLPHSYSPRIDASIHLRLQFNHFEAFSRNNTGYNKEVDEWINANDSIEIFDHLKNQVFNLVKSINLNVNHINSNKINVYIAADNQEVKDRLYQQLISYKDYHNIVNFMKLETKGIIHINNRKKLNQMNHIETLIYLIFDWYLLSLSNHIYAWRKNSSKMLSTFVHSAQKVSGTIERTDLIKNTGIGTKGYQLIKNNRGKFEFQSFWMYGIITDI